MVEFKAYCFLVKPFYFIEFKSKIIWAQNFFLIKVDNYRVSLIFVCIKNGKYEIT